MIKRLLIIFMFPLLLGSAQSRLTKTEIRNNRDYYEVIGATTGEKIEKTLYADERVIETHIKSVSAMRKTLTNEGIDPESIRVLIYYDNLIVDDSLLHRMWRTEDHPNTITSPWLDITKIITIFGETKITIRIDATGSRHLSDLFTKSENISNIGNFLSIPSITRNCSSRIISKYETAKLERFKNIGTSESKSSRWVVDETRKSTGCAPKELRDPLISLIQSSDEHITITNSFLFNLSVFGHLVFNCQDEAEEYYSELYSNLAVKGLQVMESKSRSKSKWWTEIIGNIKPIKECRR